MAVEDLRGLEKDAAEARLNEVRAELSHQVLPSDRWPLFEFRVSHRDAHRSRLHVSVDLLIADARSFEIFFGELARLYRDPAAVLPPLELTFRDYQIAAGQIEGTDLYCRSRDYWLERLPQLPPAPELPLAANPADLTRPHFTRREARLEAAPWEALQERAGRAGLTAPGVLLAAYAEVLGVWSKHARFSLNLTLFNRLPLHPQVNDIIGDFTSVALLEVDGGRPGTFEERAQRLQQQLWRDLEHRHFSGIRVMREISRSRGAGPQAIMPVVFTSTLNLSQEGADRSWAGGLGKQTYGVSQTPQVYLDFMVQREDGDLVLRWDAVDKIFPDGLIDDLFAAYRHLLRQLATDEWSWQRGFDQSARALLPEAQSVQRAKANATQCPLTDDLLHTGILKQAAERPRDLAVCAADRKLTYEDLCLRAAAGARGPGPGGGGPQKSWRKAGNRWWRRWGSCLPVPPTCPSTLPGPRSGGSTWSSTARPRSC
jgi:pyochelin synthetase